MNGMKRWGSNEFKSNLMFAKRCTSSAPTLSRVSLPDWRLKWEMTFEWDWMPLNVRSICPWCVFANRVVGGIESEVCLQSSNALNLFNRLCMYGYWSFFSASLHFFSLSLFFDFWIVISYSCISYSMQRTRCYWWYINIQHIPFIHIMLCSRCFRLEI